MNIVMKLLWGNDFPRVGLGCLTEAGVGRVNVPAKPKARQDVCRGWPVAEIIRLAVWAKRQLDILCRNIANDKSAAIKTALSPVLRLPPEAVCFKSLKFAPLFSGLAASPRSAALPRASGTCQLFACHAWRGGVPVLFPCGCSWHRPPGLNSCLELGSTNTFL